MNCKFFNKPLLSPGLGVVAFFGHALPITGGHERWQWEMVSLAIHVEGFLVNLATKLANFSLVAFFLLTVQ
jgi:hypothetical protein